MARYVLLALLGACAAAACRVEPPGDEDYTSSVVRARAEKDALLGSEPGLVPADAKDELLPLVYFPVQPSYRIPAALKPTASAPPLDMVYSDGAIRRVRRAGDLEFTLAGQRLALAAFVEADAPNQDLLFVPFADATTGAETYEGGRILELHRTATGMFDLDFNVAANPTCYLNPAYSCPVPPPENHLSVRVEAGEKVRSK